MKKKMEMGKKESYNEKYLRKDYVQKRNKK